jgi:serine/threonine-protein kinase HipA
MPVRNRVGVLGVFLRPGPKTEIRVGTLTRKADAEVEFKIDRSYLDLGENRPIASLAWKGADEKQTLDRLKTSNDKISRGTHLMPFFDNLLPEGALLELVEREFGTGAFDRYDVLARLGADLPGAILTKREAGEAAPTAPADEMRATKKPISFSIAGVQLKFSMKEIVDRLTVPAKDEHGDIILKIPTNKYPFLIENEYTALQLASLAGVSVSDARLVESKEIDGLPQQMLEAGTHSLAIRRFDRAKGSVRIHTEDFSQILGATDDQKYFWANQDTIVNVVKRFSTDPLGDSFEALRRLVVDIMLGNGDGHLKNWSFLFADGRTPRLTPAYDIVSTLTYQRDRMALKLSGSSDPTIVDVARIARLSKFWKIEESLIEREVRRTVEKILDIWPEALKDLPAPDRITSPILARWQNLSLVKDVRPTFVKGS